MGLFRAGWMPRRCLLCLGPVPDGREICPDCRRDLPWITVCCRRCALPLPAAGLCGRCQRRLPVYDGVWAPLLYRMPVDALIRGLKFHGRLPHARALAELMAEHVRARADGLPDVLLPVPLHPRRLSVRGFNQAVELAAFLDRELGVPMDVTACERVRHTGAQSGLPATERRRNLKGAFRVRASSLPRHVALVDDVMTTGATVESLARILRRQGVERIDIWVCARTPD